MDLVILEDVGTSLRGYLDTPLVDSILTSIYFLANAG